MTARPPSDITSVAAADMRGAASAPGPAVCASVKVPRLLGIDAGSTTIKLVLTDEDGTVIRTSYQKHALNIRETVAKAIHDLLFLEGDQLVSVAVTGSAGMMLSEILGFPHIQEVVATRYAVQALYPQADVVVELGGEDAKIIYLTGGVEQRMNSSCAGGTGGFLDLLSGTIGVRRGQFSSKTYGAMVTYPIASRCAVFARTDVRALLNQGARKEDIILSVYKAIVTQTVAGLACGRPIQGTVVFLGGPFYYSPLLARCYQEELGLTREQTIVPDEPHTFVALGAALHAAGKAAFMLSELERIVREAPAGFDEAVEYLPPLLPEGMARKAFVQAHGDCRAQRSSFAELTRDIGIKHADLFLGIDAGSTTVKIALVDKDGKLVAREYERHRGEFIETTRKLLRRMLARVPDGRYGSCKLSIARCVVTGYGEHALKVAFMADAGVVETAAHLRASQQLVGNVDSILDIGGQDIKYIRIVDGIVDDVIINEACSSGCGALIESFAKQFRCSRYVFADEGCESAHPVDLGTRCTVFMTSRVRHAQKEGVPRADISAGLAYSVVRNALYKVIGFSNLDKLGKRVMVQGGCFVSDAVLAAFERVTGKHALRPDISEVMGAYGCALVARDQFLAAPEPSTFITGDELDNLSYKQRSVACKGCPNACRLTMCTFGDARGHRRLQEHGDEVVADAERIGSRTFITGNRCEKPVSGHVRPSGIPNTFRLEQQLLDRCRAGHQGSAGQPTLGITCARELFETLPFWTTFAREAGFSVLVSDFSSTEQFRRGIAAIPAEGACYPSKLVFGQIAELAARGADAVLLPQIDAGFKTRMVGVALLQASAAGTSGASESRGMRPDTSCPVASHYADVARANPTDPSVPLVAPDLIGLNVYTGRKQICDALESSFAAWCMLGRRCLEEAFDKALAAQHSFEDKLHMAADEALAYMEEHGVDGALMACHSYHVDPGLSHGIDELLGSLGFVVFSPLSLAHRIPQAVHGDAAARGWYQPAALYDMCEYAASMPGLELVHLYSFACGVDAMAIDTAADILRSHGKIYTGLKLDEMVDLASIRIRLRSLRAAIDQRRRGPMPKGPVARPAATVPVPGVAIKDCTLVVPGIAPAHMARAAEALRPHGYRMVVLEEYSATSADTGLRYCHNDLCYSTVSLVGNVIEHLGAVGELAGACMLVPQTCSGCRSLENEIVLRDGMSKAAETRVPIVGFPSMRSCYELSAVEKDAVRRAFDEADARLRADIAKRAQDSGIDLKVGVIGNFNLLYTPGLNGQVFDLLLAEGACPVFPAANEVLATGKPLPDLIGGLYGQGVCDVIYLQAFGCLTGNVYGAGAAKEVKSRYPDVTVTFIDYDPGISQTNQVNRIKLALAVAREGLAVHKGLSQA